MNRKHYQVQMISEQFSRGMLYEEFTAQVLQNASPAILSEQAERVERYYNRRTGKIISALNSQQTRVLKSSVGVSLESGYLIDLRFLDLKLTASGKKKKLYGPVYNRPLWGYVYGYVFGTLRYGLTQAVQTQIFDQMRESYKISLQ